jgi:hypothetical protein
MINKRHRENGLFISTTEGCWKALTICDKEELGNKSVENGEWDQRPRLALGLGGT